MSESTLTAIESAMQPLAAEFGLKVTQRSASRGYAEVSYANDTTGLNVAVDWFEFRPFVHVHQRRSGDTATALAGYEGSMLSFDADDLLQLREASPSPVGKMISTRDDVAAGRLLAQYADALCRYAADVMRGDFTVFPELERRVEARAATMKPHAEGLHDDRL